MIFRMNVRRAKSLVWVMNIATIVGIILLFMVIYKKKSAGEFEAQDWNLFKSDFDKGFNAHKMEKLNERIDLADFAALWEANISGIKKKDTSSEGIVRAPTEDPDPLSQIVTVRMIVKTENPEDSRVRLFYPKDEVEEEGSKPFRLDYWSKEGDPLKSPYDGEPYLGKIVKIEEDKVIFSYKGEEVTIKPDFLSEMEGGLIVKGQSSIDSAQAYEPPQETEEYKPDHWNISVKEGDYLNKNYESELNLVTLTALPNPKTGKTELTAAKIEPDSLAYKRGFRQGDILISINGYPVHTKTGAINYVKEHPDLSKYIVEIERNGKPITKVFNVPKK